MDKVVVLKNKIDIAILLETGASQPAAIAEDRSA